MCVKGHGAAKREQVFKTVAIGAGRSRRQSETIWAVLEEGRRRTSVVQHERGLAGLCKELAHSNEAITRVDVTTTGGHCDADICAMAEEGAGHTTQWRAR